MKMIVMLVFIYSFIFVSCAAQTVTKIKVCYVDIEAETPISVNCENFELLFNSRIKTDIIINKDDIDAIYFDLNNLQIYTTEYSPDIRAKIIIGDSINYNEYCISSWFSHIFYKHTAYIINSRLKGVIKKYIK